MKKLQAGGKIDKGELIIFNEDVFWQQIQNIGFVNHVKITIEYGNKRTLNQNAYFWGGIVKPLSETLIDMGWVGYDEDFVYHDLESNFSKEKKMYNEKTGEYREKPIPLKNLDTDEFGEVIDDVRNWVHNSTKIDLYLKAPHEYYGIDWSTYDKWKRGEITRTEAMKYN